MTIEADAPLCLARLPLDRLPKVLLPEGTIDAHFHVFKQGAQLSSPRNYSPQVAPLAHWQAYAKAVHISRGVLVQPSVYGFDNHVLIDALTADPNNLRGVVVLNAETRTGEIERLDLLGVRGVRINTRNKGGPPLAAVPDLAARLRDFGWLLQFQVHPDHLEDLAGLVSKLTCPVVFDHLGFILLDRPEAAGNFATLQKLLDRENCHVKISAPYRLDKGPEYRKFGRLVRSLVASHPEKLVWGSDWPHSELWADMPDDGHLIDLAQDWFGTAETRRKVFVDNAEKLFFTR